MRYLDSVGQDSASCRDFDAFIGIEIAHFDGSRNRSEAYEERSRPMYDQARMIIETTARAMADAAPVANQGRGASDNVQSIWRRHGWVPPTEQGKDFRATLRNTADRVALAY